MNTVATSFLVETVSTIAHLILIRAQSKSTDEEIVMI